MYYLDKRFTIEVLDYEKHFDYPFKLFGIRDSSISVKRIEIKDNNYKFKKSVIIPSSNYPLPNPRKRNEIRVFNILTHKQLDESINKDIIEAFNTVKFEIGRCYYNSVKLQELLEPEHKVQLFSGYFFTTLNVEPTNHCWLYVDDCFLLDLSNITVESTKLLNSLNLDEIDEMEWREKFKKFQIPDYEINVNDNLKEILL